MQTKQIQRQSTSVAFTSSLNIVYSDCKTYALACLKCHTRNFENNDNRVPLLLRIALWSYSGNVLSLLTLYQQQAFERRPSVYWKLCLHEKKRNPSNCKFYSVKGSIINFKIEQDNIVNVKYKVCWLVADLYLWYQSYMLIRCLHWLACKTSYRMKAQPISPLSNSKQTKNWTSS